MQHAWEGWKMHTIICMETWREETNWKT